MNILQVSTFLVLVLFTVYKSTSLSNNLPSFLWELAEKVGQVGCSSGITSTGTTFCVLSLVLRCIMNALNTEMQGWMTSCIPASGKHHHVQYLCSQRLVMLRFCYGKISEISVQLNKIYGIFVLLSLTYHNAYFHLEAFDTLRNIYNYVLHNIESDPKKLYYYFWLFVDGGKILMYFITVSLLTNDCKKFKVNLCLFTNGLSSCKLRESVLKSAGAKFDNLFRSIAVALLLIGSYCFKFEVHCLRFLHH